MSANQDYVVAANTAEFNKKTKEVKDNVRGILNLTAKVYDSKNGKGIIVQTAAGPMTITKTEVRKMWKPVLKSIRELRFDFNAAKRKKRGKKSVSINAFTQPMVMEDNAYQFFTTSNMGMIDPQMANGGYSFDANGMLVAAPLANTSADNQQLAQYLAGNALFGQRRIARRAILQILFYVYARQNLLSGNADGTSLGIQINNRGKPYVQWNTKYYGATEDMARAFASSFNKVRARSGQAKVDSSGNPETDANGLPKTYQAMNENFFDGSFFSIAASDSVKSGPENAVATPDKETLKRYGALVEAEEAAIKASMKAAKDAGQGELAGFRLPRYKEIAAQVAPGNTALATYAEADELQKFLSYVNRLHAENFKRVDEARQKYRDQVKKAQKAGQTAIAGAAGLLPQ